MSPGDDKDRSPGWRERLMKENSGILETAKLSRPDIPAGPTELPVPASRYPVLQELAAQKQSIHDEFSGIQLDLQELRANLEADLAVISGPGVKKADAPAPPLGQPAAAAKAPVQPSAPLKPAVIEPVEAAETKNGGQGRRWLPWAAAAAVLCLAVFVFTAKLRAPAKVSMPLPPTAAAGLCLDASGSRVFFTDPRRQLLITVSATGRRVETMQSFQAPGLKMLAFDGVSFWSSDGTNIYRHSSASGYPAESPYKAGPGVFSLSWDGKFLWAASAGGRLVRYAAGDKPSPEAVYQLPENAGAWLAVSGGRIWELDPGTGRLAAYTLAVKPEPLARAEVRKYLPAGDISGFAVNGDGAWVITAEQSELVRLDLKRLKLLQNVR